MKNQMHNIRVILVEPQGDGNIGQAARAMKNCDIKHLCLVNPVPYNTDRSREMACSALDVLLKAKVFSGLKKAVSGSSFSVGFTARTGKHRFQMYPYDDAMNMIANRISGESVSLVFGREDDGLTNDELEVCDYVVSIPASKSYTSFNLSQAVLVSSHDIFMCASKQDAGTSQSFSCHASKKFISKEGYKDILGEIEKMIGLLGYELEGKDGLGMNILTRIGHIFARAGMYEADKKMMEGLLSRLIKRLK
jgi:TrmH family RNA methyltransferase